MLATTTRLQQKTMALVYTSIATAFAEETTSLMHVATAIVQAASLLRLFSTSQAKLLRGLFL